jgi:hypothetical protein
MVVTVVVYQAGRIGDAGILIDHDGALILSLHRQPPGRHPNHPLVMRVLIEHIVHLHDRGDELVVGRVLRPFDHQLLRGRYMSAVGKCFFLLTDLLRWIKAHPG